MASPGRVSCLAQASGGLPVPQELAEPRPTESIVAYSQLSMPCAGKWHLGKEFVLYQELFVSLMVVEISQHENWLKITKF